MEQNVSVTVSVGDLLSMNYSEDLFDAIAFDETVILTFKPFLICSNLITGW